MPRAMRVEFYGVGRRGETWQADLEEPATHDHAEKLIAREAARKGVLASNDVDAVITFKDGKPPAVQTTGFLLVGGFRRVGAFTILSYPET